MPELAAIALGSNLGDRSTNLDAGVLGVAALDDTRVLAVSAYLETAAVGPGAQGAYFNAAMVVQTGLSPRALLDALLAIELANGRDRSSEQRWGARTLDLDLLLYADRVIDEPGLSVPHPRLHERAFVLEPLAQIAPGWEVPGAGRVVAELLAQLPK
ncbi:MAG: 2-amino-4-hydroxy-6-hydroxymethyldihydropteridine diphosphokinase [Phycisphaeraceae bacterium]|nr:MAG: 2-amino-4-hydroxy-6-hydroxymethyldihydropteridine diphosphokinase [Phycisphaeraceae bacterium]